MRGRTASKKCDLLLEAVRRGTARSSPSGFCLTVKIIPREARFVKTISEYRASQKAESLLAKYRRFERVLPKCHDVMLFEGVLGHCPFFRTVL